MATPLLVAFELLLCMYLQNRYGIQATFLLFDKLINDYLAPSLITTLNVCSSKLEDCLCAIVGI